MALRKPGPPREDPQQYVLKKNYKKAIELYRAQVKDAPEDANLALRLADVLVLDSQNAAAVTEYKRAAKLYADQGFLLKAIGVNKKIVKLDPSQEEVHQNLSKLYEERGLLATPQPSSAPAGPPGGQSGEFRFDMEAAPEGGAELDLGVVAASASPGEAEAPAGAELAPDDLDLAAAAAADLAPEPVSSGFDLAGAPAATEAAPASGFDFGLAVAPASDAAPEVSVDALGDALHDMSFDSGLQAVARLGGELRSDDFGATGPAGPPSLSQEKIPLFSDFTPEEFVEVVRGMGQESFHKDQVVVREGDPGDALFVVVSGSVRVVTTSKGRELPLAELHEGDFFGEGSLITGKPRTATVIASEDTELLSLNRAALDAVVARHPRVKQVLMSFYQQRAESTVRSILKSRK